MIKLRTLRKNKALAAETVVCEILFNIAIIIIIITIIIVIIVIITIITIIINVILLLSPLHLP